MTNVLLEKKGHIAVATINRPKALNALNAALMAEVAAALDAYEADERVGCVIITGSQKAFAAGADIKEMQPFDFAKAYMTDLITPWDRVAQFRQGFVPVPQLAGQQAEGEVELARLGRGGEAVLQQLPGVGGLPAG